MRTSEIKRTTAETDIKIKLDIDGKGTSTVSTGCGFLDHMLTLFAKHGSFDLAVTCKGDTEVDYHHTTEDVGITLGLAFAEAAGERRGITRYGNMLLPMDEALILTAVDISGRSCLVIDADIPTEKVGDFDCELVEEFWLAFTRTFPCALHIRQLAGKNSHHIIEGMFKSTARSLRQALAIDPTHADEIPSTKGVL